MFYGLFNSNTQKKFYIAAVLLTGLLFFGTGTNNTVVGYSKEVVISDLPEYLRNLEGYREEGMVYISGVPRNVPLGGGSLHKAGCPYFKQICNEYTHVSSDYYDKRLRKGKLEDHGALDFVIVGIYSHELSKFTGGKAVIFATMDGTVIEAEYNSDSSGRTIRIVNDSWTLETGYSHLELMFVKEGDYVIAGTPIAIMGDSGCPPGAVHLHYWVAPMSCPEGVKCKSAKFPIDTLPCLMGVIGACD